LTARNSKATKRRGPSESARTAWIETPARGDREIINPLEVVALEQGFGGSHYPAAIPEHWICSFMDRLTIEIIRRYPAAHAIYSPGSLWGSEGKSQGADAGGDQVEGIDHTRRSRAALIFEHGGRRYGYAKLGMGAPVAAAGMERLIALGAKRIIITGTVGVIDPSIRRGDLIVATRAIREEGTSYHYLPAARFVQPSRSMQAALRETLDRIEYPHRTGTTWTTDAFYRETRDKIARMRLRDRAICVEMEAAAMFAVGRFRKIEVGALFYASDAVGGRAWDFHNQDGGGARHSRAVLLDVALKTFESMGRPHAKAARHQADSR
jgi:nucleoside phosphorylase